MVKFGVHLVPGSIMFRQSCPIGSDSDSTCRSTNTVRIFVILSPLPQLPGLQHYSHYQSTRSMEKRHLQNLTVAQLANKFPHFHSVLSYITTFTRDTHWALSRATWIQPTSFFIRNKTNYSFRAGPGWNCSSILVLLESCMTYTIAECTVNEILMMDRGTLRNM